MVSSSRRVAATLPTLVLALGMATTAWITWRQETSNRSTERARFDAVSLRLADHIASRFRTYEYGLRGARGVILGAGTQLSRDTFLRYHHSRDIAREFPGALGFGFVKRVAPSDLARFESEARIDGWPDFTVRQIAPHRGERFVIQYIEPSRSNASAIGLDLASEPARREAAVRSMRSGMPTLSAPIELIQRRGDERLGFLFLLPVFEDAHPPSEEARERATIGWVYAPLAIARILDGFDDQDGAVTFEMSDVTSPMPSIVYTSSGHDHEVADRTEGTERLALFGRQFAIAVAARPEFRARLGLPSPVATAFAGSGVTTLIAMALFVYMSAIRRRIDESIERNRLAAIVEGTDDAIIATDMEGTITSVNAGATSIFGYTSTELVGQPLSRLHASDAPHPKRPSVIDDQAPAPTEKLRTDDVWRNRAGEIVDIWLTESTIRDVEGAPIGRSVIARDTTERTRSAAALRASERRFRDLAEMLPEVIWTCDAAGVCDYVNRQWLTYSGTSLEEATGRSWLDHVHVDDLGGARDAWSTAARASSLFEAELRLRGADGIYRWFSLKARPTTDETLATRWFGCGAEVQALHDAHDAVSRMNDALESRVRERTEQLHAANSALEGAARELREAQRIARVGGFEFDPETRQSVWSDEMQRLMQTIMPSGATSFDEHARFFEPASWSRFAAALSRSAETGEAFEEVLTTQDEARSQRVFIARGEGHASGDARTTRVVGTFHDVTDYERVRAEVLRLSGRVQLATTSAGIGIWEFDIATQTLVWDETTVALHDREGQQTPTTFSAWLAIVHPDDREALRASLDGAIAGRAPLEASFRAQVMSGDVRHLRTRAVRQNGASPADAPRLLGVIWDVTDQRVAELSLRETTALQRAILDHSGPAIIATDTEGTITLFNRAAEQLLGYAASDLVGKTSPMCLHVVDEVLSRRSALEAELGTPLATMFDTFVIKSLTLPADANQWTYVRKDGMKLPVLLTVSALRDDNALVVGFLGIAVDLSTQKRHEDELRTLNRLLVERTEQAESANHAKSLFLANMSHEIRTPIGAVTGGTHLLGTTRLSRDQRDLVAMIDRSSKLLLSMINDVLDLAKIEAGELMLDPSPTSVAKVADDIASIMTGYASGRDLELVVHVAPDLPDTIGIDRTRVLQIMTNLAGNAIKFTPAGMVRTHLSCATGAGSRLRVEVSDNGPGVPEAFADRIFAPFTQADSSWTRRFGGTGLGLSIVKQLVTSMLGEVGFTNNAEGGSTFWFEIPFVPFPNERVVPAHEHRVVVIDSCAGQRAAIVDACTRLGWVAFAAQSARDAFAMLTDRAERFEGLDLVVIDSPGLCTAQWSEMRACIDATGGEGPSVWLLAAPGAAATPPVEGAGRVDGILRKPVTSATLMDAAERAARDAGWRHDLPPSTPPSRRLEGVRVLVVDDNEVNRSIACRILGLEGARTEALPSGEAALARLDSTSPLIDVVLMDVQMPEIDGIEATRAIRGREVHRRVPIIALTAGALASERERALSVGMDDFVAKPFEPSVLVDAIRRHAAHVVLAPEAATFREVATRHPPSVESTHVTAWPEIDGIDTADVRSRFDGDSALFIELLAHLAPMLDRFLDDLPGLREQADTAPLSQRIHAMRGSAANLGAVTLNHIAKPIEGAFHSRAVTPTEAELDRLASEVSRLRRGIAAFDFETRTKAASLNTPRRHAGAVADRDGLAEALESNDLSALEIFSNLEAELYREMGSVEFDELARAIGVLDFEEALSLLPARSPRT